MVENARKIFEHSDSDGDRLQFLTFTRERITVSVSEGSHGTAHTSHVYLDAEAVDKAIMALAEWRGTVRAETTETFAPVATDDLDNSISETGRMLREHREDRELTALRQAALALAVQLHSRSPFEHDSGDHALDTAEEFSRWLLDGTRDRPAEPTVKTSVAESDATCFSCLHEHEDDGVCRFMSGADGACACPLGKTAVASSAPNPLCPICRHSAHGRTHCGERNTSAGDRTRCKCVGVVGS